MRFAKVEQLGAQGDGGVVGGGYRDQNVEIRAAAAVAGAKGLFTLSEITLLVSCYVCTFAMKYQDSL